MFSSTNKRIWFRRNFGNLGAIRIYRWQAKVSIRHFNIRKSGLEKKERTNLDAVDNCEKTPSHKTFTRHGTVILISG
jgi:hypothetical protein